MPYLAMIDRLKMFLKQAPSVLVVCGYSFSDQHLNEVLHQELQGNARTACFALLYGALKSYPDAIALAQHRPNLTLFAEDGAMLGTREGIWMVPKETDLSSYATAIAFKESVKSPAAENGQCSFKLGDFGQLGGFLAKLMGPLSHSGGMADA